MKDTSHQNKVGKTLKFLLFIVAFSIPISSAFNSISLAVLFLFSFLFYKKEMFFKSINTKEIYAVYLLIFIIQALSISYATNKELAFETVKEQIVFFILPITFINLKDQISRKNLRVTFLGLFSSVLLTLIVAIYNLFYISLIGDIQLSDFFRESFMEKGVYTIHVPYFSLLIVFLITATVKFPFFKNEKNNRVIKLAVFIVLTSSLFFLSGIMSLVIFCLFSAVLFFKRKYSIYLKIGSTVAVAVLLFFSFNYIKNTNRIEIVQGSEHIAYRAQKFLNSNDPVRKANWKSVFKVISNNVILGAGADGGLELLQKERSVLSESYINKHNAHNEFLEIILRHGLIGIGIYLLLLSKLIQKAWQENNYFLKWFLVVFVISGITESYLQRQVGLTFFSFFSLLLYNYKLKTA